MVHGRNRSEFGNAASHHAFGFQASACVRKARAHVAELAGCHPSEVIFTSGATEANNFALRGLWEATRLAGDTQDTILLGAAAACG